jgi:hypothetical protein
VIAEIERMRAYAREKLRDLGLRDEQTVDAIWELAKVIAPQTLAPVHVWFLTIVDDVAGRLP